MDEVHKMPDWKTWLKGVVDSREPGQALLVTDSARVETWRQSGDSLAGRYQSFRFHPISVREWCEQQGGTPHSALESLMQRGGFPEHCMAENRVDAERWRQQYFTDLIREDIVEFSRLHETNTMRLFVELLRERVGSPLSLASFTKLGTHHDLSDRSERNLAFQVRKITDLHRAIGKARDNFQFATHGLDVAAQSR